MMQPIETAPRDRRVDLVVGGHRIPDCEYAPVGWVHRSITGEGDFVLDRVIPPMVPTHWIERPEGLS